jgi:hypothetical protein
MARTQYSYMAREPQHGSYWSLETTDLQHAEPIVEDAGPGKNSDTPPNSDSAFRDTVQLEGPPTEEEVADRQSFFHWQARFRMIHLILTPTLGSPAASAQRPFQTVGVSCALSVLKTKSPRRSTCVIDAIVIGRSRLSTSVDTPATSFHTLFLNSAHRYYARSSNQRAPKLSMK